MDKKILETLTAEQDRLCDQIAEEYLRDLTAATLPDGHTIKRWLDIVYLLYDQECPNRIEIVESPHAALLLATELTKEAQTWTDDCGIGDGGWLALYDYYKRIDVLSKDEAADLLALRDFSRVAWDSVLLDECAIVIQRPIALKLDDEGRMHCSTGPCIEWADGEKDYSWHGIWVPERVILAPRSHTRAEYLAITNTEERRALSEAGGWAWVAEVLGATPVDSWTDPKTALSYELLRCEDGQQLLSKESPRLKNGSQPRYLEPVNRNLRTAQAARKWQAVPSWTPDQCEKDPVLNYGLEA